MTQKMLHAQVRTDLDMEGSLKAAEEKYPYLFF